MREREPRKEIINQGELFFLWHPGTDDTFSAYGLTMYPGVPDILSGLLVIDRPTPADPEWLKDVKATFGPLHLVPMTETGERGLLCQMTIAPESLPHLRQIPGEKMAALQQSLQPLLENPPRPVFTMHWDQGTRIWRSTFTSRDALPGEIRGVLDGTGYGCLAAETNLGVIHVCYAADEDIAGFADKPVRFQWQLIKMPTAPLIRLEMLVLDIPLSPYQFESFYNVAQEDQARILAQLANQENLYLAFFGDGFTHYFTKIVRHDEQQWQYLDDLVTQAHAHWDAISEEQRDFDLAKAMFIQEVTW